jgi:hypothetical protein
VSAKYAPLKARELEVVHGFPEVSAVSIKEVLRLWLSGHGVREIARIAQVDRKTVRRYVAAARAVELSPPDGSEALSDEVLGAVVELVRPGRNPGGHGRAWEILSAHRAFLEGNSTSTWRENRGRPVRQKDRRARRRDGDRRPQGQGGRHPAPTLELEAPESGHVHIPHSRILTGALQVRRPASG